MKNYVCLLLACLLFIAACGKAPAPVPTPSPSPSPSPTPSPVPGPNYKYARGFVKIASGNGLAKGAPFVNANQVGEIPVSFDWRALGFAVPVRNQGQCGSCWDFSTVANADAASWIFLGKQVLFSEQQVLGDSDYAGCGGGDFAGDFVVQNGLMLDSDCPYNYSHRGCSGPIAQQFMSWANLGAAGQSPTVEQIQLGIMEFGYISVDVAADSCWDSYSGGVMTCDGSGINHMTALVGWDGLGNWIMRNSWGTSWGDSGYALVPYGSNQIATDAAYLVIKPVGAN